MASIGDVAAALRAAIAAAAEAAQSAKGADDQIGDALTSLQADLADSSNSLAHEGLSQWSAARERLAEALALIASGSQRMNEYIASIAGGGASGGSAPAAPAEPVSATDSPTPPSGPIVIGGRTFSIHAQERMADPTRNVTPAEIESALSRGRSRPGRNPGTIDYYDAEAKIHVVTTAKGDVVTVRRQSRTPGWAKG